MAFRRPAQRIIVFEVALCMAHLAVLQVWMVLPELTLPITFPDAFELPLPASGLRAFSFFA